MKKNLFSILLVVVMTLAMVACGTQETTNDVPVSTETIEATVESDENSEAVSETEQATEAPVDEVASTPDDEVVETVQEPETSEPEFTFTELNATKYATQSVNVRSGPSTDYDKIGGLTTNQEVQVTGQASTGWYRFTWTDGREAYVSDKYLSDSKVEVAPPANNNNESGSTASGKKNWQDYYQDHVWYDMDRFFFIIVDSREEGTQTLDGNNVDYSGAEATLQARFPDEKVYLRFGCPLRDGHWMFFAYIQNSGLDPFIRPFE